MSKGRMNRRQFMQTSATATAGAAVLASGAVSALSTDAWAASKGLDAHTAKTLLTMARDLFPHDNISNVHYMPVVDSLDDKAAKDAKLKKQLTEGVAGLDKEMGIKFVDLSEAVRIDILKKIESSGFFGTVRWEMVVVFYTQPAIWANFGYEGPSDGFGGYIERGFDDLGWLPDPPESASPKAYKG